MRVLYVDDDPAMTAAVEQMLSSEGYDCESVTLGKQAVELARNNKYDIILLDIMMPDIDGYEVVERLRKAGVRTPILVQSGLVDREQAMEDLWLGTSEYLIKPFNKDELIGRIQTVLSRPASASGLDPVYASDAGSATQVGSPQRRRHRRFETAQPGRILHGWGIDCVIVDMSYGGASIQLPSADTDCPKVFDLKLRSGSILRCQVRWRSGDRVGVQGETQWPEEVVAGLLNQGGAPAEGQDASAETRDASAESQDASAKTEDAAAETQDVPAEGQDASAESQNASAETQDAQAETQNAPTETEDEAAKAQDAPAETQDAAVETPDLPAEAQDAQVPPEGPVAVSQPEADPAEGAQAFRVDRGIRLVAETCECSELVVEGYFEAAAQAKSLRVGPEGRFVGSAEVAVAEIMGHVEGSLTVTGRLLIHPTGTMSGSTSYRQIEVESGGRILGKVRVLSQDRAAAS
jgi:DNA-binding response OmpR family regulator